MTEAPSNAWALRLPASLASALAPLRLIENASVGEDASAGEVWLRGEQRSETLDTALHALPATARYEVVAGDRLRPRGALLIERQLPALAWQPLREWLRFSLPVARLPAEIGSPEALRLVAAHDARAANAALFDLETFLAWMRPAPELRLAPLRFAASRGGRALVLGTPLPPLPGRACVETAGVIVPAGLRWLPEVSVAVVRRVLAAPEGAIVLWDEAGAHTLGAELFVPASRSAARASATEFAAPVPPLGSLPP